MHSDFTVYLTAILAFILAGCTGSRPGADWSEPFPERTGLTVVDSIGTEMGGDSLYVFGSIADVTHSADGGVVVLDMVHCCIRKYTEGGEYAGQAGRHGDGPGELLMPMYVTLLSDESIMVTDMSRAAAVLYDAGLEFLEERRGWPGLVPLDAVGTDSGDFVAMFMDIDRDPDDPGFIRQIGRFGTDEVPENVYLTERMSADITSPENLYRDILNWYHFTSDRSGNVYFAPWSTEEWHVTGMNSSGEVIMDLTLDLPRAEKTETEMTDEKLYIETWIARTDEGLAVEWHPDPYRYMIRGLGVDCEGRLWVHRGTEPEPVFDVFDTGTGEHLFTAEVTGYDSMGWVFTIDEYGILAFRKDSDSDQKVYLLSL